MSEEESKALTTQTEPPAPAATSSIDDVSQMFKGLLELVKDPSVSPEKASAMLDVQERLIDKQALMAFTKAKMQALAEMPSITRDGAIKNKSGQVQSKYSTFEAIDAVVRPICMRFGLVYSFNIGSGDRGAVMVTCKLGHVEGHVESVGPMAVPLDQSGSKNATQGSGSAASYGKRYTLCAALNIVTHKEDDDGQAATRQIAETRGMGWEDEVLTASRSAALEGTEAYNKFFTELSPMKKGWLVEMGHHQINKDAAASHGE